MSLEVAPATFPKNPQEADESGTWANGITVKRTTTGYTWTVAVSAGDGTPEAFARALAQAKAVDAELAADYGTERGADTDRPAKRRR